MKAKEILTSEFYGYFAASLETLGYQDASDYVDENKDAISAYSILHYGNVPFWDFLEDMATAEITNMVCIGIGHTWSRIYDVLKKSYDPLENYFTDRTMDTTTEGSITKDGKEKLEKKGKETTAPSGIIQVSQDGEHDIESENTNTIGQGTTYDSATTDPESTSDFYNISKTIAKKKDKETFNDYGTKTSFQNYKVEHEYANRVDEKTFEDRVDYTSSTEGIEEHRNGNSGIFAKQDLIQREIKLRLNNQATPILVRMIVDQLNTGVW